MDMTLFPTKGNLIVAKNTLRLCHQGYDLLDKKRNILVREMMNLVEKAKKIQNEILVDFQEAYAALQGRTYVIPEDVKQLAPYVLGHRIILKDNIRIRGTKGSHIINNILSETPVPTETWSK
jgi:V/A-type H+-transporting ATPase subunit D